MRNGLLIAVEGFVGLGKTTQARALHNRLKRRGIASTVVTMPWVGERYHSLIKYLCGGPDLDGCTIAAYAAARCAHVENVLRPRLEEGGIVIVDDYFLSLVLCQNHRYSRDWLFDLAVRDLPGPDVTIALTSSPHGSVHALTCQEVEKMGCDGHAALLVDVAGHGPSCVADQVLHSVESVPVAKLPRPSRAAS